MKSSFTAVIFDLDGLLVDSEPLQFKAYREAFTSFGAAFSAGDWPRWHQLEASASRWIEAHDLDIDPEALRARKKLIYEQLVSDELTLKPGAGELVEALSGNYRLAVASGSRIESIEMCLQKFSLLQHFELLQSATELKRKKPFPDVYLTVLERMQISVGQAVAFEDSRTGCEAAVAAGLRCVVCPDVMPGTERSKYPGASLIVDSLADVDESMLTKLFSPHENELGEG